MKLIIVLLAALRRLRTLVKAKLARKIVSYGYGLHIGARTRIWAPKEVIIGNNVYIGKDVHIEADCSIGDYCLIANRVAIIGRNDHDYSAIGYPVRFSPWIGSESKSNRLPRERVVIGDDVWLGYGAIILTGIELGKGCVVAAGSVVTKSFPEYSVIAGCPARLMKKRFASKTQIDAHEAAIERGKFVLSEKGYDHCVIRPGNL